VITPGEAAPITPDQDMTGRDERATLEVGAQLGGAAAA
jgi:hypothetical protein